MLRLFHCVLILTTSSFLHDAAIRVAALTKADIPADVSENLRLLIEQTFSENSQVRASAAKKLGEMHEQAAPAVPFLMRLIDDEALDETGALYHYVNDVLVSIGEPALDACIASVKETASRSPPPEGRHWQNGAIGCLGGFKSPRAVDALVELLKADDVRLRRSALHALLGCTDTRATMPLLDAIEQYQWDMRLLALSCFRTLPERRSRHSVGSRIDVPFPSC